MAEAEQPKKGCTTKFSDTLGKMDALAFSLLSLNLQNILSALGITSLKGLKSLNLRNINLDRLIALLMSLKPDELKKLLTNMNLSSLNIRKLLQALGLPLSVLEVLDILQQNFKSGNGIYTGATSVPGIAGTQMPNSGWQAGDDINLINIDNPPKTGAEYPVSTDYYSNNYLPLGCENSLNVLSGLDTPEEKIMACMSQGGDGGLFAYDDSVESVVRWEVCKFVPWSEIGGNDFLRSWILDQLGECPAVGEYCITKRERIDQIAYEVYGSTQYWWILLHYNGVQDLGELKNGKILEFPSLEALEELYFQANSKA